MGGYLDVVQSTTPDVTMLATCAAGRMKGWRRYVVVTGL